MNVEGAGQVALCVNQDNPCGVVHRVFTTFDQYFAVVGRERLHRRVRLGLVPRSATMR